VGVPLDQAAASLPDQLHCPAQGDRRQTLLALAAVRDPLYAEVADQVFASDGLGVEDAARRLANLLASNWQRSEAA
jgi:shikimate kinase